MTVSEVVNKLAMEQALALGDLDALPTCRRYIQMALAVGIEHFTKDMEEIIVMNFEGIEVARHRCVTDIERKMGIRQGDVSAVLTGRQHSAGGYIFIKAKDKELVPARKSA